MTRIQVCDMALHEFNVEPEMMEEFRDVYVEYVERLYADDKFNSEQEALRMFNAILEYYGSNRVVVGFGYSEENSTIVMNLV